MSFIKEGFLKGKKDDPNLKKLAEKYIVPSLKIAHLTIFLSYSHKDIELAKGFQNLLAQYEVYVYIDLQDSELPETPNRSTAETIKDKIKTLDLFFLLATNNALSSKWCPWEIGIADTSKDYNSIYIVPITDQCGNFIGNEYLQLYKRIEISNIGELFVLDPQIRGFNISFSDNDIKDPDESLKSYIKYKEKIMFCKKVKQSFENQQ